MAFGVMWSAKATAEDWDQWRGPRRDGISRETQWLKHWPPTLIWRRSIGEGYASVSISDGRLYTVGWSEPDGKDTLHCIDATTGDTLWTNGYPCCVVDYNGPRATPTVNDDKVYTYTQQGHLYCFDKDTGAGLWDKRVSTGRPHWGFSSSPLIEGDLVILNAGGAGTAVSKNSPHNIVWSNPGYALYASPVPLTWKSQRMVAVFAREGLFGVDSRSGEIVWSSAWRSDYSMADPVLYGNKILFCNGTDHVCALLQLGEGELRVLWQNSNVNSQWSSPVLIGDCLYAFGGGDDELICLDMQDGTVRWSVKDMGLGEGGMTASDGKLIVLGQGGKLAIINASPKNCDMEGRSTVDVMPDAEQETWWTSPVLCNGRIYCRSHEGTLVCLAVGSNSGKAEQ